MFGDNQSVVTSSTIPHSNLSKRWNALSYHKVREAVAGGWLRFEHIPGTQNPADVLTKALAWYQMRVHVEPLLFWKGDTLESGTEQVNPEGSITVSGSHLSSHEQDLVQLHFKGHSTGMTEWHQLSSVSLNLQSSRYRTDLEPATSLQYAAVD